MFAAHLLNEPFHVCIEVIRFPGRCDCRGYAQEHCKDEWDDALFVLHIDGYPHSINQVGNSFLWV